jgi:hypothetical protein
LGGFTISKPRPENCKHGLWHPIILVGSDGCPETETTPRITELAAVTIHHIDQAQFEILEVKLVLPRLNIGFPQVIGIIRPIVHAAMEN